MATDVVTTETVSGDCNRPEPVAFVVWTRGLLLFRLRVAKLMATRSILGGRVTEHLDVAAGSYACQWKYGEQVVAGMLHLEASKPPAAEVFDAPGAFAESGNLRIFEPHADDLAVLRGWTRRGDDAALLAACVEHFPDGRSFVKAQTALAGTQIPVDMLFGSAEFQVGGLTEISGIRPP